MRPRSQFRTAWLAMTLVSVAVRSSPQDASGGTTLPEGAALQAEERITISETAMGRSYDPGFRQRLRERFVKEAAARLRSADGDGREEFIPNAVGDSGADLLYTPTVPCRIFDTRLTAQGLLTPGTPRDFVAAGAANFPGQGGTNGGCGVPLGPATSVVVNLTVVDGTGPGNLRAWAFSNPPVPAPLAAVLTFGSVSAIANAVVLPICDPATVTGVCTSDLRLQTAASSAHVVGDVLGYFRALDIRSEIPVGAEGLFLSALTGDDLLVTIVAAPMPPRLTDCAVTCSISVASSAPNVSGSALVQSGAQFPGGSGWSGTAMPLPRVSSAGTSSVSQSTSMGFGASLSVQFGCHIQATGDFIGDEARGTVAWTCR